MMNLIFEPWRRFQAFRDHAMTSAFMRQVAEESTRAFRKGIRSPKSGRMGRFRRASAPGEYPARQTGALDASIRSQVSSTEATIGTNVFYSKFLREGTRKMARRRMSDDALQEGIETARTKMRRWVRWERG